MVDKYFESERLKFVPFRDLDATQTREIENAWANPLNARYDSLTEPYGIVAEMRMYPEPTFKNLDDWNDCMAFRAILDKKTGEAIGTCRFGKWYESDDPTVWDYGFFNIAFKHWRKGLGVEALGAIVEQAKKAGAKVLIGEANSENFGSYNSMIKNGFVFEGFDGEGDYQYSLELDKPQRTESEIEQEFAKLKNMFIEDFGQKSYDKVMKVNNMVTDAVKRVQNGENERKVVKDCFTRCNAIMHYSFDCASSPDRLKQVKQAFDRYFKG